MRQPQFLWAAYARASPLLEERIFFSISNLNYPAFNLKPFSLVISLHFLMQSFSSFLAGPFRSLVAAGISTQPSLLQAEQPLMSHPVLIGKVLQSPYQICSFFSVLAPTVASSFLVLSVEALLSGLGWGSDTLLGWCLGHYPAPGLLLEVAQGAEQSKVGHTILLQH